MALHPSWKDCSMFAIPFAKLLFSELILSKISGMTTASTPLPSSVAIMLVVSVTRVAPSSTPSSFSCAPPIQACSSSVICIPLFDVCSRTSAEPALLPIAACIASATVLCSAMASAISFSVSSVSGAPFMSPAIPSSVYLAASCLISSAYPFASTSAVSALPEGSAPTSPAVYDGFVRCFAQSAISAFSRSLFATILAMPSISACSVFSCRPVRPYISNALTSDASVSGLKGIPPANNCFPMQSSFLNRASCLQ